MIINVTASSGSYLWTLPNTPSTTCRVRITDQANSSTVDESDNLFTIEAYSGPFITLVAPNGNEYIEGGSSYDIEWVSSDIDYVKIEYSPDFGENWNVLTQSTDASNGIYSWSVPETESEDNLIKVSDVSNSAIKDESNASFYIFNYSENISISINLSFGIFLKLQVTGWWDCREAIPICQRICFPAPRVKTGICIGIMAPTLIFLQSMTAVQYLISAPERLTGLFQIIL